MMRTRSPGWLVLIYLVVLGGGSMIYFRGPADSSASQGNAACAGGEWRTSVAVDQSRPELAMTTLRSKNEVGPPGRSSCVDVNFACSPEGPYFEVRVAPGAPAVRQVGPLQIRNLDDDLALEAFQPADGTDTAVRVADKPAVELIAFAVSSSLGFKVPITFVEGEDGLAEFRSYHFLSAIRPVLYACNMRALRLEKPDADDDE